MNEALPAPADLSKLAPAILQRQIPTDKIKELIGPGGKVIRGIQETSGAILNVDDQGKVTISAAHRGNALLALKMINELFAEAEVGKVYKGKVKGITTFGAFVEILPGKEGLVHISELAPSASRRSRTCSPWATRSRSSASASTPRQDQAEPQGCSRLNSQGTLLFLNAGVKSTRIFAGGLLYATASCREFST